MKKLMKMFKNLPPEVRMLLAMAGLGTPIGAIYFLRRFFPHVPTFVLILCIAGIAVVIALITALINAMFTRGRKRRARSMAAELAGETAVGPRAIDVSAAIKANNERFFNAIRDMRKNIGVSVYDLPWYIVIGDSGCGKTKLVNEGGLTFSTGKPEGYQLGTLNYNWWFTEDAIFVDMAGRLCNPQDDSDRREWMAFLDAIAKGRKGFPINGAVVCVSAEHLLQDPPEKQEADANVALERLRDLQTKLGVTFATYLVVTKCDKILGFMQFFDRATHDITIKNQIVGWSKPGSFNELYDPERFKESFDEVYKRLHELRLRRLSDEAEEIELGLAYSFPEEFRRLYEPLQIYARTLFPYIRNPRAVKNLIFRGVYFTSATQEGELILKHLKERLGQQAADQFPPLDDLYPNKRPHFIKDVLFRKVFPEHGLVFRNEQQVVRNKQLNKLLKVGTAVLTVVLVAAFWWSTVVFSKVIGDPRTHAGDAAKSFETVSAGSALQQAGAISTDVSTLKQYRLAAQVLSTFVGADRPISNLERVRVGLVEKTLVQALADVDAALRSGARLKEPGSEGPEAFRAALVQYLTWFGCRDAAQFPPQLKPEEFKTLCAVVVDAQSITKQKDFPDHTAWYFGTIKGNQSLARNPAMLLARAGINPEDTIRKALDHVYKHYLDFYATIGRNHADDNVREWMRMREACLKTEESYKAMLDAAERMNDVQTLESLAEFKTAFLDRYGTLDGAINELVWRGKGAGTFLLNIRSLRDLLSDQRKLWLEFQSRLRTAATSCGVEDKDVIKAIETLSAGDLPRSEGLDRALWRSLQENGIVSIGYSDAVSEEANFKRCISEVYDSFPQVLAFTKGDGINKSDQLQPTENAQRIRGHLRTIRDNLAAADISVPDDLSGETPDLWISAFEGSSEPSGIAPGALKVDDLPAYWRPTDLRVLYENHGVLLARGQQTRVLMKMLRRLEQLNDEWGYARLLPYEEMTKQVDAPYAIKPPPRLAGEVKKPAATDTTGPTRKPPAATGVDFLARGDRRPEREEPTKREPESISAKGPLRVPACVTPDFLLDRATEWVKLLYRLGRMEGAYLYEADRGRDDALHLRCTRQLRETATAYTDAYVKSWGEAYKATNLRALDELARTSTDWQDLAGKLARRTAREGIAREFESSLEWILQSTRWATYHPQEGISWQSFDISEWKDVAGWVRGAMEKSWNEELGSFVFSAKSPEERAAASAQPWTLVADALASQWLEVADKMGVNAKLQTRFKDFQPGELPARPSIPWGEFKSLRDRHGLGSEKLSGQVADFEGRAQDLLSAELGRILYDIQKAYFGEKKPDQGWPYLTGEPYSATGLDTVGFVDFKNFLVEVRRAEEVFKELEKSLPKKAPGWEERRKFYADCGEWYEFLGLKDAMDSEAKELAITIRGEDPMKERVGQEKVDDSAQHAYKYLVLDLGLILEEKDDIAADGALWVATLTEQKVRERTAKWGWAPGHGEESTVRLADRDKTGGLPPLEPKKLGRAFPLALCAYLNRHGKTYDNGKTWYMTHRFDLGEKQQFGETRYVGERLEFTLDRRMPDPIRKLTPVGGSASGER